jgi:putative transposase
VFHVLNRSVGKKAIFEREPDYAAFEKVLQEARQSNPMRLLAYCLMPNHWHLVLWPEGNDDLSRYMRWITQTHTQRWHKAHDSVGTGPLYQGRFKSFPIAEDDHFYQVCRYVERNSLRANLVSSADMWHWKNDSAAITLDRWPCAKPAHWLDHVNAAQTEAELRAIERSLAKGAPYGNAAWCETTAKALGLEHTLRKQGRPRKHG